mmetsp:Transcript_16190/g.39989  ORF Transcript_16190/g.39989 Transcript_16190/m.39989 type:complete len:118 (+) Transcript_16190:228-581(+)
MKLLPRAGKPTITKTSRRQSGVWEKRVRIEGTFCRFCATMLGESIVIERAPLIEDLDSNAGSGGGRCRPRGAAALSPDASDALALSPSDEDGFSGPFIGSGGKLWREDGESPTNQRP